MFDFVLFLPRFGRVRPEWKEAEKGGVKIVSPSRSRIKFSVYGQSSSSWAASVCPELAMR